MSAEELLELLRLVSSLKPSQPQAVSLIRYALLLALGEYSLDEIPASDRDQLLSDLADWYANDPSSGVHGAAGWLLRQWGQDDVVQKVDQTPVPYSPDREWFTLAITVTSPRREYASPDSEAAGESTDSEANAPHGQASRPVNRVTKKLTNGGTLRVPDSDTAEQDSTTTSTDEEANQDNSEGASDNGEDENSLTASQSTSRRPFISRLLSFSRASIRLVRWMMNRTATQTNRVTCARISRPFAVLNREVTFGELIAFDPEEFTAAMNHPMIQAQPTDAGSTPRLVSIGRILSLADGTVGYARDGAMLCFAGVPGKGQGRQSGELACGCEQGGFSVADGSGVGGCLPVRNADDVRSGIGRGPAWALCLVRGEQRASTCIHRGRFVLGCEGCSICTGTCLNGATIGTAVILGKG